MKSMPGGNNGCQQGSMSWVHRRIDACPVSGAGSFTGWLAFRLSSSSVCSLHMGADLKCSGKV
eukprot:355756-Pelagomonas_calceolata.AAC.1